MKIAYFDCFSGISFDMTLGAFLDAGLSLKTLSSQLSKLNIKGYSLKASRVKRAGISGTKFDCIVDSKAHNHRPLKEIMRVIDRAALGRKVKTTAKNIFSAIGEAERKIHGVKTGDALLHELGEIDSIIDIVGTAIAMDALSIDEVYSSPVTMGRTMIDCSHGRLPIPGPASLELLKGAPVQISALEAELVTPTGASILNSLCRGFGPMPMMKIGKIGYGAGTKDFVATPNMLRVVIGETKPSFNEDRIVIVETNIDDMNPQFFEYVFEKLFEAGALDVYTVPIQMKKSRPAFKLTVLVKQSGLERVSSVVFRETTSIGLRFYEASRYISERKIVEAGTKYGKVGVKLSYGPDGSRTISPEYDDCARLARAKKIPLKIIYDEAKRNVEI